MENRGSEDFESLRNCRSRRKASEVLKPMGEVLVVFVWRWVVGNLGALEPHCERAGTNCRALQSEEGKRTTPGRGCAGGSRRLREPGATESKGFLAE